MDIVTESEMAAMIMMSGGSKVIHGDFTLSDAAELPTAASYTSGICRLEIKFRSQCHESISYSPSNYEPFTYYLYGLFYNVWYCNDIPFMAVPTSYLRHKQVGYRWGSKGMYISEIDQIEQSTGWQFTAPELPSEHKTSTEIYLQVEAGTFSQTAFDENGEQTGHVEYDSLFREKVYPFRMYGSYGLLLTSYEENPELFTKMLMTFYSQFNISR